MTSPFLYAYDTIFPLYFFLRSTKKKATLDTIANVAWAGAGGALSGGIMGGAVNTNNYLTGRFSGAESVPNTQQRQDAPESVQSNTGALNAPEQQNAGFDVARAFVDPEYRAAVNEQATNDSTIVNTDPTQHTAAEQSVIDDYQNAVDDNLLEFYNDAKNNQNARPYHLKNVSDKAAADIKTATGQDVTGFKTTFEARQAWHIDNDHGQNGKADHSMANDNDVARIQYVLDNYDTITNAGTTGAYWETKPNGYNRQAPTVAFSKKVNGTYYVVEAVPDTKAKSVYIVSAYMLEAGKTPPGRLGQNKTGNVSQLPDASAPWFTAKTDSANTFPAVAEDSVSRQYLESPSETSENANTATSVDNSIPPTSQNSNTNFQNLPQGTGAASAGFMGDYGRLMNQATEFIKPGENPAEYRYPFVPAQDFDGRNVSATVRTALEAEATPEIAIPTIQQAIADGRFSYDKITNAETLQKAKDQIDKRGYALALADWKVDISKRTNADNVAMGWALYNGAVNGGNTDVALDILSEIASFQRQAAQALAAQRILKTMSPDAQLYAAQRSVADFQEELTNKYGDKAPDLEIDEELVEDFLDAQTDEERSDALYEIYKDIGRQMPATAMDKWNAWRYLAMLGNLRTHGRNMVGNAGFAPVRAIKNALATTIEYAGGDKLNRTKAFLNYFKKADRQLLSDSLADYANVQEQILSSGKWDNGVNVNEAIADGKKIFRFKPLEAVRRFNNMALNAVDGWFAKPAYAKALASWLKANDVTLDTATAGQLDEARAYAVKEAQKATYRDTNAFSEAVTSIGFKNADTGVKKVANTLIEGVLPFRKTPADVLVRGVEYSPIGLIKSLTYDAVQVHKGNMSGAQMIDNLSAGLTGTGLMALGGWLASLGFITAGASGDDKKDAQDKLTGHQYYALEIGGKSITLDWLAPEAIPFFMGVELWNNRKDGKTSFWDVPKSMGKAAEPMLQMSMLQSLNDLLEAGKYSESNKLLQVLITSATSYLTQAIPTLGGQLARSIDGTRRTSYTDKNSEILTELQYTIQSILGKIPGAASTKQPYIDAWGREETEDDIMARLFNNFVNPAYVNDINETDADKELQRLYDAGAGNVFPKKDDKSFNLPDGSTMYMSASEYTEYSRVKGTTALEMVSDLIDSREYEKLSDDDKADLISDIYSYASAQAKQAVSDYKPDGWIAKAEDYGNSATTYMMYRREWNNIPDTGGTKEKVRIATEIVGSRGLGSRLFADIIDKNGYELYREYGGGFGAKPFFEAYFFKKDAKTITLADGTKLEPQAQVYSYIDRLQLTAEQKDALFLGCGYAESSLKKAPWR